MDPTFQVFKAVAGALLLGGASVQAAQVVSAEYFIGNDPGAGSATAIALADTATLATGFSQASLSLSGRAPGTYTIGIRVKDDQGRWSNPALRRFTLSAGAYQLAGGLDRNGAASQGTTTNSFTGSGHFAGGANAEYFIGSDPGAGSATAIALADTATLATGFSQASLSLSGRAPGTYTIGIRVKDDQGRWSNPALRRFTMKGSAILAQTVAEIASGVNEVESTPRPQIWIISPSKYYADAMFQVTIGGKVLQIQRRPEETLRSFMLRLQQAISGDASLGQMVVAEMLGVTTLRITNKLDGVSPTNWVSVSAGLTAKIEQVGDLGTAGRKIVAIEYFSDIDPGEGNGHPISLSRSITSHEGEFDPIAIDIEAIKSGNHRIGVRFKNAAGRWGAANFRGYGSFLLFGVADITPPVITLTGSSNMNLPFGQNFLEPGFTATDNIDGILSGRVVSIGTVNRFIPGIQKIKYTVVDSSGNLATVTRQINVLDATPPVFTGDSLQAFVTPPVTTDIYRGLSAQDAEIGSLSHRISLVSGSVNWGQAGSYLLVFEVSDTAGNTSRFNRTITLTTNATRYPTFNSWMAGRSQGLAFTAAELQTDFDADHDGLTNGMEWSADTDPFDAFSKLEMDFARVAAGLTFQWACNQRINYWIDSSSNLENWSRYSQEVNTDQGNYFALDVPISANSPNGFFRLSCKPRQPVVTGNP